MASSKLTSRNSDLKRKLSTRASTSSDFLKIESSRDSIVSDSATADTYFRNAYVERNSSMDQSNPSTLVNAEIRLSDAVGAVSRISDGETEPRRRTAEDVWREILEGKKNQQKQKYPKEEEITLEDFLVKVGAVEAEEARQAAFVEVKEEGLSGGMYSYENNSGNYSAGVIGVGAGAGVGMDVGGFGRGRGRRSLSLMKPLDKAEQQRQRRMIKNRESAARSRERKQAYQMELESVAERLEEENGRLLNEMAEHTEKRLKQIMENVIPVTERRKPPRVLQKVRSMEW